MRDALIRPFAGLATAIIDGLFSSRPQCGGVRFNDFASVSGVAATPWAAQPSGGANDSAGVFMLRVAFGWSAVFTFAVMRSAWVRRVLALDSAF
jgi:hypothetical protein